MDVAWEDHLSRTRRYGRYWEDFSKAFPLWAEKVGSLRPGSNGQYAVISCYIVTAGRGRHVGGSCVIRQLTVHCLLVTVGRTNRRPACCVCDWCRRAAAAAARHYRRPADCTVLGCPVPARSEPSPVTAAALALFQSVVRVCPTGAVPSPDSPGSLLPHYPVRLWSAFITQRCRTILRLTAASLCC